jgi:hypothetical protein
VVVLYCGFGYLVPGMNAVAGIVAGIVAGLVAGWGIAGEGPVIYHFAAESAIWMLVPSSGISFRCHMGEALVV